MMQKPNGNLRGGGSLGEAPRKIHFAEAGNMGALAGKPRDGEFSCRLRGGAIQEGFERRVELAEGGFEYAREGKDAASLIGRLSQRSRRMSLKDLQYGQP